MHYYKFNIADYRKDTTHLSMLEHGIYRTLIDWYYLDEHPLTSDIQKLSRRLSLSSESDIKFLQNVLNDFFELTDSGYKHKRINVDILDYHENATKNRANGMLGGRPKKTQSVTDGNPLATQMKGNHKPLTINQEPVINVSKDTLSKPSVKTPSQQLLDSFHSRCTYLPKVQVFTEQRKKQLKARFMQVLNDGGETTEKTIEFFDKFYEQVNRSKFLCGLSPPGVNGRSFKADWDWIHNPSNFVKIYEGKYDGI